MFKEKEYVMYEATGVCLVRKIGVPDFIKDKNQKYYFLKPLYSVCDSIFVPVDSGAKMRRVLDKKEADELIDEISSLEARWISDAENREEVYKDAIKSFDCRKLLEIIKTLYLNISQRKNEGKKPLQMDEKYMNMAESYIFGELSVVLGISIESVRQYITQKVEEQ